jgi:hypothetical protein
MNPTRKTPVPLTYRAGFLRKRSRIDLTLARLRLKIIRSGHNRPDDFKVAQFLGRNIVKHVLAARIVFARCLCKIVHDSGKFTVGSAKLFPQQRCESGIRFRHTNGVFRSLLCIYVVGVLASETSIQPCTVPGKSPT